MAQDRDAHRPGEEPDREPRDGRAGVEAAGRGEAPDQAHGEGDGNHDRRPDQEPDLLRHLPGRRAPADDERRDPGPECRQHQEPADPSGLAYVADGAGIRDRVAEERQVLRRG